MGKTCPGSVCRVLDKNKAQQDTLTEHTMQELAQQAIFDNIHRKRFILAKAAPICNRQLRGQFGYNAITITAKAVLNGTYEYQLSFDQAAKKICK